MSVQNSKGGGIVWICVKYCIIEGNQQYKAIGIRGFYYKLFEYEEGGGVRKGLYGYPYSKHPIQLWPVDWVKHMEKMNEAVGMKIGLMMSSGNKWLVRPFRRQDFWKFIGCVLLVVTYGKKGEKLWSEIPNTSVNKAPTKLQRDVCDTTNLNKVCCDIYRPYYFHSCH